MRLFNESSVHRGIGAMHEVSRRLVRRYTMRRAHRAVRAMHEVSRGLVRRYYAFRAGRTVFDAIIQTCGIGDFQPMILEIL